jgi:TPR repeat protein
VKQTCLVERESSKLRREGGGQWIARGAQQDIAAAAEWWRKAAANGSLGAAHELGALYCRGDHPRLVPQDTKEGLRLLASAADQGNRSAQVELGNIFLSNNGNSYLPQDLRDDTAAIKWFTMAADQHKDAYSQHHLGIQLRDGRGVKQDVAAAAEWFRKAIENGSNDAAYALGMLHYEGDYPHLVPKDTKEGLRWLTSAAEQGHIDAQTQLGLIFEKMGSDSRAEKWYTAAADQGGADEQYNLALFYRDTPEYLPDQMTAQQRGLKILHLLSTAASMGNLESKVCLGIISKNGFRSIQPDVKKSTQFFVDCINDDPDVKEAPSLAAAHACFFLASLPGSTLSTIKTSLGFTTPLEWFTFGATHGDSDCQYKIAEMYFEGSGGLSQDYALASFWVDKSFTQGNQDAAGLVGKMQHRGVFVRPPSESEEEE